MKKRTFFFLVLCVAASGLSLCAQPLQYTLLAESRFMDDCLICGRPTIAVPLHGTFMLVPEEVTPLFTKYRLDNIAWVGGFGTNVSYDIRGSGTYTVGGEIAVTKQMMLNVTVNGREVTFTNSGLPTLRGFPDYVIDTSLAQTQQNLVTFYSMDLLATPLREVWFSINQAAPTPARVATAGDLLSTTGRIVKRDTDLAGRLGFMPVANLSLDAVEIMPGGGIWFSINQRQFSETLGQFVDDGDIVSPGRIVRKYYDLIGEFYNPKPTMLPPDPGLDALHVSDSGSVLFSVRSNFFSTALGTNITHGDLLIDRGEIFRSNAQLLQRFQPATAKDYGLDAVYVWPSGEIWFSTEEGFVDQQRGTIQAGDILSDAGYIAFRNQDLLLKFPTGTGQDLGDDALFVVTDLSVAAPPRITSISRAKRLRWEGPGHVFQVEKATKIDGPYLPATPIMPDTEWIDPLTGNAPVTGFYRVRQW